MRRLPIYFVLETNADWNGEPIEAVRNGLSACVSALHEDPIALQEPQLIASRASSLGKAFMLLTKMIIRM